MKKNYLKIAGICLILVIVTLIILRITIFRKYEITLDFNNGNEIKKVLITRNKTLKGIDDFDEISKYRWYEVINKDGKKVASENEFNFDTKITRNMVLLASTATTNKKISVKFITDSENKMSDIYLKVGSKLKLSNPPTKEGYKFVSWFDEDGVLVANGSVIEKDLVLYARWEKVE